MYNYALRGYFLWKFIPALDAARRLHRCMVHMDLRSLSMIWQYRERLEGGIGAISKWKADWRFAPGPVLFETKLQDARDDLKLTRYVWQQKAVHKRSKGETEMLTRRLVPLPVLLLLALLLHQGVSANSEHHETLLGSLSIASSCPADLVGFVVIGNPGLEKTITNHIPPFLHPIFVDVEVENEDAGGNKVEKKVLAKHFDTFVALTNGSASSCSITLTVMDAAGTMTLSTLTISLNAKETRVIFLADLVP